MPPHVRLLALLILAAPAPAAAQDEDGALPPVAYPSLPDRAAGAAGFVPAGWLLEASASGDIDRDGRSDLAMVLRMNDPANVIPGGTEGFCGDTLDTNPRIVAVALAEAAGGYRLGTSDNELMPRRDNPCALDWFGAPEQKHRARGDPHRSRALHERGRLGHGATSFTFRWEDAGLRLIGYDFSNVRRNTGDVTGISINYLTGRAKLTRGRMGEDRETVRWVALHNRGPITIDWIGNGLEYDPERLVSGLP